MDMTNTLDLSRLEGARRLSRRLALSRRLSVIQMRLAVRLRLNPPERPDTDADGRLPITIEGAYWRGRDGVPNVHAPGCLAFAAWRAGDADRDGRDDA